MSTRESQIEEIAKILQTDKVALDEQDETTLGKYYDLASKKFNMQKEHAIEIVNEALLYLKMKDSDSFDLLEHGDKFGAGFS